MSPRDPRPRQLAHRGWPVAGVVARGSASLALAGAGSLALCVSAAQANPTTRHASELYYETQTGPESYAIAERDLSSDRPSTKLVVALRTDDVFGIALGGRWLYWSTQSGPRGRGSIMRAPRGGGRARRLVGGLTDAGSVVAVGGDVYWADANAIGRVALDGSHLQRSFISLPAEAGGGIADGLASDGRYLYFSRCADHTIGRATLGGRDVDPGFIAVAGRSCPQGLAATHRQIYWTELGRGLIGRVDVGGRHQDARWCNVHTRQGPFQVAVGDGHVYWTWGGENDSPSYTGGVSVTGARLDRRFLPDSMYPMAVSTGD